MRTVELQHDVLVGPAAAVRGASDTTFLVDLSGVTFMDSSSLRALLNAFDVGDGKRVIVQSSRQLFKLLLLSGLAEDPPPNVEMRPPRCVPLGSGF